MRQIENQIFITKGTVPIVTIVRNENLKVQGS